MYSSKIFGRFGGGEQSSCCCLRPVLIYW